MRHTAGRRVRAGRRLISVLILATLTAAGLASAPAVVAVSCNGASHDMTIDQGGAQPGVVTAGAAVTFHVRYRDNAGCAPAAISVRITGFGTFALSGSGNPTSGVTYSVAKVLPVGTWSYAFHAESGSGPGLISIDLASVSPPTVVVQPAATPTPAPTPQPTPKPTPPPTPEPTPRPTPRPTPPPTATPTPTPTVVPSSPVSPSPQSSAGPFPSNGPHESASPSTPAGQPTAPTATGGGSGEPTTPAPSTGSAGPVTGWHQPPDQRQPSDGGRGFSISLAWFGPPAGAVVQSWLLVALAGVAVIWMLIGRRSRMVATVDGPAFDGPPNEAVRAAATGAPTVAVRGVGRRADGSVGLERPPLRFPHPPAKDADRRVVDYRMVALRAGANELRTSELGRLDRGDEVEIIESDGSAVHVRTPEGQDGWVPRVTVLRRWTPPGDDTGKVAT